MMRRSLLAAAAGTVLFSVLSCTDEAAGPQRPLAGRLAVVPNFGSLQGGIVDVARGRFVLTRIPSGVVARDTVIDIPAAADSVDLSLTVPVLTPGETFALTISLISSAGDTVFQGGPLVVTPGTSGTPVPVDVPFTYVGTGANAAGVRIVSPDTSTFTGEPVLLTAEAFDGSSAAIPGTPIGWTSLDTTRVAVTADAQYRGVAVGGGQRGVGRLVATLVTGQTDTVLVSNQPLPTAIVAESGAGQSARADSTLAQPLVARVTAGDGLGVRGVWVRFAVTSGAGALSADSVRTDSSGRASVLFTLARSFQPHVVSATTPRLGSTAATFGATLLFEPPDSLEIVAGDGQTAAAGSAVAVAPQVRALDAGGLPVPGVTVTFAVTGGGGVVAGGTPVTDTLGLAAVTSWTLGNTAGLNTLTATLGSLTATFSATGTAAGPGVNQWIPTGGLWSDPAKWSLGRIPIPGDTVELTQGLDYQVTMDVSATVANLTIGGTGDVISLDVGDQTLTITDPGPGSGLDIQPLGSIQVGNGGIVAAQISNQGSVRWTGAAPTLGTEYVVNLGGWTVAGGQLTIAGEGSFDFRTSGLLRLENDATMILDNGFLTYLGGGITAGLGTGNALAFTNGAELGLQANLALDSLVVALVNGRIQYFNGDERLTIGPDAGISMDGTTLAEVTAIIENQGVITATAGAANYFNDSLYNAASGAIAVNATGAPVTLAMAGSENQGIVTLFGDQAATLVVQGGGSGLTNRAGASLTTAGTGAHVFTGILVNESGATVTVGSPLTVRRPLVANHVNAGTLDVTGGNLTIELTVSGASFTNQGAMNVTGGNVLVTMAATAPTFVNAGTITVETPRSFSVSNSSNGAFTNATTGVLAGTGTFNLTGGSPTVSNLGTIAPGLSPGVLTWQGNLPMGATSAIEIELGGTTLGMEYDQLSASGSQLTLDGTLNVTLTGGFQPAVGDSFAVITGTRSGTFAAVNLPTPPQGVVLDTGSTPTTYYVIAKAPPPPPIVFAGDSAGGLSSGIFSVNPDGSGQFQITTEGPPAETEVHPRWAPDRTRITYSARAGRIVANQLHIRTADGSVVWHLTSETDTSTFRPRYSPAGVHLAFECGDGGFPNSDQDVCAIADVTNPADGIGDGAGKVYVTDAVSPELGGSGAFAWNPQNPDQLAVVRDSLIVGAGLGSQIWLVNYDGSGATPLGDRVILGGAGAPVQVVAMDWSPDGSFIAFEGLSGGTSSIYRIELSNGAVTQLTSQNLDHRPVISPDNTEILFGRENDLWVLYKISADGQTLTQLSPNMNFGIAQAGWDWSPDGSEIVVTEDVTTNGVVISKVPRTTNPTSFFSDANAGKLGRRGGVEIQDRQPSWRP